MDKPRIDSSSSNTVITINYTIIYFSSHQDSTQNLKTLLLLKLLNKLRNNTLLVVGQPDLQRCVNRGISLCIRFNNLLG